jgi:MoaA/NifB/PqqE/SkfB family radical SAM enzyme
MIETDYLLDLIMGFACNVECDYCTMTRSMRTQNLSKGEIADAIRDGAEKGLKAVSFGGGEPTIRKDLVSLVALARDAGFERIKIQSNGLMYAYPDFVDRLMEAGANQFNISIMGRDRAMYHSIMGAERHFDLVVEGIGNLVRRDALVIADVIMKSDTWEKLPDTIGTFADFGVEHFVLWLVSLTDRNKDNLESLVPVSTMRPGIYETFETGRRRGIEVFSRHIPACMLPDYPDHIWNVRQDHILIVTPGSTFWLKDSRITANTFVEGCEGCAARETCLGVRRDYLERYGDGEVEPIPG